MIAPITSDALLALADDLVRTHDASTTVRLRCAVSSAYYALFHGLIADAARLAVGKDPARETDGYVMSRWYSHGEMRSVSEWTLRRSRGRAVPSGVGGLLDDPPPDLVEVAASFVALQQARHRADYDQQFLIDREKALAAVDRARRALGLAAALAGTRTYENYLVLMGAARRVAR